MDQDIISSVWPEWSIVKQLGKGAYGVVYEAVRRDYSVESRAAIKVISIPASQAEVDSLYSDGFSVDDTKSYLSGIVNDFVGEIQLMESLKGVQNIVSVEDYKVVEHTDRIAWTILIRMELLTPLNAFLGADSLPEKAVVQLGIDICSALEICAMKKIIHRDIKPENIFINQFGDYKLGDFGVARKLENVTGGLSQKGTYNYMAPEVEKGTAYNETADIYSLGLVLYRFLNGKLLPFLTPETNKSPNERVIAVRRRLDGEPLNPPSEASPAVRDIILKATAYDPRARYKSASEMKRALNIALYSEQPPQVKENSPVTGQTVAPEDLDRTMSVRKASGDGMPAAPSLNGGGYRTNTDQIGSGVKKPVKSGKPDPYSGQSTVYRNVGEFGDKKKKPEKKKFPKLILVLAIIAGIYVIAARIGVIATIFSEKDEDISSVTADIPNIGASIVEKAFEEEQSEDTGEEKDSSGTGGSADLPVPEKASDDKTPTLNDFEWFLEFIDNYSEETLFSLDYIMDPEELNGNWKCIITEGNDQITEDPMDFYDCPGLLFTMEFDLSGDSGKATGHPYLAILDRDNISEDKREDFYFDCMFDNGTVVASGDAGEGFSAAFFIEDGELRGYGTYVLSDNTEWGIILTRP